MTNIEQNALRIAELLDYDKWRLDNIKEVLICRYSAYDYLMEIVESEISDYELKSVHFELEGCVLLETVQKYNIKYLELKNDSRTN